MCDCYCCDSEPAEIDVIYLVVKITSDIDNPDCETKENIKFYYKNDPQNKARIFCDAKNKIIALANKFSEKLDELDFEEPVFSKPEPIKNKELIAQLVLTTKDGNSKNSRKAGREINKYNSEFKDSCEKWKREKDSFLFQFLKTKFIELMDSESFDNQELNDILDSYISKEYLASTKYEVELIQST